MVPYTWNDRYVIGCDMRNRVRGIGAYPQTVMVDSLATLNILPEFRASEQPPVPITEAKMLEILGSAGDYIAGLASARTKEREAVRRAAEMEDEVERYVADVVAIGETMKEQAVLLFQQAAEIAILTRGREADRLELDHRQRMIDSRETVISDRDAKIEELEALLAAATAVQAEAPTE